MLTDQVIGDGSLKSDGDGFRFDLRMPWYRALPLSSLERLEVRVDGEPVPSEELRLSLGGTTYALSDLPHCSTTGGTSPTPPRCARRGAEACRQASTSSM